MGYKEFYQNNKKCKFILSNGEKCKSVVKNPYEYCRHHIPKDLLEQNKKYNDENKINFSPVENKKENFSYEIQILKNYLKYLVPSNPKNKKLDPKELKLQIQIIEQIRKLIHSLSTIENQNKIYKDVNKIIFLVVSRIVEVLNKHLTEPSLKQIVIDELNEITSNEDSTELSSLINKFNPTNRINKYNNTGLR